MSKHIIRFALCILILAVFGCSARMDAQSTNLLANPGFEGGWTRETIYWTPEGGPYFNPFGEIFTPDGWVTWWREGFECASAATFQEGRPEVHVIDKTADASRVRSGNQAAKEFTFWRCHDFGLLQQVDVTPGSAYSFSIYGQSWHSNCSSKPYNPPLASDCETPLYDSWDRLQVGIDPNGNLDPAGSGVIWGDNIVQYGHYDQPAEVSSVVAISSTITVFVRAECNYPLKHNDVYWDDAELIEVEGPTYSYYLPFIVSGY